MPSLETFWIDTEHAAHRMAEALRTGTDATTRRELEERLEETKQAWRAAARQQEKQG